LNYGEMIFVFGSNLEGRHGKGAAKFAADWHGAVPSQGSGPMGTSYALPTKRTPYDALRLDEIARHVEVFLDYARRTPEQQFMVSRIGCSNAGYADAQIAPLFADAPENCHLSGRWCALLKQANGTAQGYRCVTIGGDAKLLTRTLTPDELYDAMNQCLPGLPDAIIVGNAERGFDRIGGEWSRRLPLVELIKPTPAYERYGKAAPFVANRWKAWLSTNLITLGKSHERLECHLFSLFEQSDTPVCPVDPALLARLDTRPPAPSAPDLFGDIAPTSRRPPRRL
jgi:hypothetical protein